MRADPVNRLRQLRDLCCCQMRVYKSCTQLLPRSSVVMFSVASVCMSVCLSVLSVCLYVCNTLTFESIDVETRKFVFGHCVLKLYSHKHTQMSSSYSSLDWVLSHSAHFTVRRFICVYVYFVCFGVFLFYTAQLLYYCEHGGVDLIGLKSNPQNLSSFSAVGWVI